MEYIAPISSATMAIIWVIYLQLLFIQYRRNNRPYLIFHHAQHENPDALCLLVNMGERAIHIQSVQAAIKMKSGEECEMTVTEFQRVNVMEQNVQQKLRQGPLMNGGYLILGTFRDIMENTAKENGINVSLNDIETLELRAAAIHAPSKHPVGARREFMLTHNGKACIFPKQIYTEQLVRRRHKRKVVKWIEAELNPQKITKQNLNNEQQSQPLFDAQNKPLK